MSGFADALYDRGVRRALLLLLVGCPSDPADDGSGGSTSSPEATSTVGATAPASTSSRPDPGSESGTGSTTAPDPSSSSDASSGSSSSGGSSSGSSSTGELIPPSSDRHTAHPLGTTEAEQGYWEYLPPDYDTATDWPLLVFLHGIGSNGDGGDELPLVAQHGPPLLIESDDWPNDRPFVVLSPQYDGGACPPPETVQSFLAYAIAAYDVDPERVYLTGLSCGAIGGWDYLAQYTDSQVAATVLIAGNGGNAWFAAGCDLGLVPIWAFHGDADGIVDVSGTTFPVENLLDCVPTPDVQMTIYPGVGHNSWAATYDLSAGHDIYAWLLEH